MFFGKNNKDKNIQLYKGDVVKASNGSVYIILDIYDGKYVCYSTSGEQKVYEVERADIVKFLGSVQDQIESALKWVRTNFR